MRDRRGARAAVVRGPRITVTVERDRRQRAMALDRFIPGAAEGKSSPD